MEHSELGTRNREPKGRGISGACHRRHRRRRRGRRFRFRRHISFLGVVFTNTRSFGSCASTSSGLPITIMKPPKVLMIVNTTAALFSGF